MKEAKDFYKEGMGFYKKEDSDQVWWLDTFELRGPLIFSFDKKELFNFWTDYPDKLSTKQKAIFDKENLVLVETIYGKKSK